MVPFFSGISLNPRRCLRTIALTFDSLTGLAKKSVAPCSSANFTVSGVAAELVIAFS
jgi:hypothetical protein